MWEQEWLEGKISKEEAEKRAEDGENIMALLQSLEQVSQFEVKTYLPHETAWKMLEEKIAAVKKSKVISLSRRQWMIGVAASFILAIGALFLFQKLSNSSGYSITDTGLAQTTDVTLPDGSMVYLNAKSSVSYEGAKWDEQRTVNLVGEGFFEVVKGSKFVVETAYGNVEVLGTSFNVKVRNGRLEVKCKTGKVRVTTEEDLSGETITQGEMVTTTSEGMVTTVEEISTNLIAGWRTGDFDFEAVMLIEVLEEFERQFDVELKYNSEDPAIKDRVYNGYFSANNMNEAIQLVCNPMGLQYKIEDKVIRIQGNRER